MSVIIKSGNSSDLAAVKPASTSATNTDPALVVQISPNSPGQPVTGTVAVSNFPATQAVSASSLPLPTGAATSANQTTGNTSLSNIDTKIPALGQTTMAGSTPVVIASNQSAVPVSGTVTANAGTGTFAVSASSLPLPTGAATAAKQPAIGTAGTASADVITVQGIASMTPLKVDGSATTQPVSGTVAVSNFPATQTVSGTVTANAGTGTFAVSASSLPLPSGAATSAKQPALGTAGSASSDVLTVQGIASMTALKVDGSAVTQPVSGTVTANVGTTNGLALDATLTGGTQKAVVRGGAKGTTSAADVTSTVVDVNTQALDVSVKGTATVSGSVSVSNFPATQAVSGTVTANAGTGTFAVSAASLPLPSGAATAAKQPALGTAGTASSDVITVQGIASMTALKVDGSAVTQPVSGTVTANIGTTNGLALDTTLTGGTQKAITRGGAKGATTAADVTSTSVDANTQALDVSVKGTTTVSGTVTANAGTGTFAVSAASLPLPSGAATAAKQPALGTAGTASADVITVQGIASMTALKVDGSAVTQPVSGTVTANAGTGNFTVTQATGTNLHVVVDSAPTTTVTGTVAATQSGTWSVRAQDGAGNALASSTTTPAGTEQALIVRPIPSGTQTVSGTVAATQSGTWNVGLSAGTNYFGKTRITDGTLDVSLLNAAPGSDTGQVAMPVRVISSLAGGAGGTSSSFAAAFPASGTAAGFSDGTNMQGARVFDVDSGAGTQYVLGTNLRVSASGGSVEAAAGAGTTSASTLRVVLPTDQTAIPASQSGTWSVRAQDGSGNALASSTTTPAGTEQALIVRPIPSGTQAVSGTVTANAGTGNFTVTQATASNLNATVTGTVTANVGTTNGLALDATLTGGTQKAIVRGGAKGATTAADVTSTAVDANTQALDVSVKGTATVSGTVAATQSGTWSTRTQDGAGNALASSTTTPAGTEQALIVRNIPSGTQTVSGTVTANAGTGTFAISAASLPLPTGAATETTLGTLLLNSTFTGRLPAAAALADATANPSLTNIGSYLMGYNGTTWDRLRSSTSNGLVVDVSRIAAGTNYIGKTRLTDGTLDLTLLNAAPGSDTGQVSIPVRIISSLAGGAGGTSSTYGAAFPASGTASGFSDGTNMQGARVFDVDTGAGTQYVLGTNLRVSASGGSVEAAAGAGTTSASTLRVVLPTDQTAIPASQSGTWNVGLNAGTNYIGKTRVTDGTLDMTLLNSAPGSDTGQVSIPVRIISSLAGGAGGTSSNYGSAFPTAGTASGFSDGTNMQGARVFDVDTGAGSQFVLGANLRVSASGGSAEAAAGAGTTSASTLRVVLPTDQTAIPASQNGTWNINNVSGTVSLPTGAATAANQTTLGSQTTKINDGTNTATVKAASTSAAASDPALVVALSPNIGTIGRLPVELDSVSDAFDQLVTVSRIPQVDIPFFQTAPANLPLTITLTGTGTTAQGIGLGTFSTGTGVTSRALAVTNESVFYTPHTEIYAAMTASFTAPTSASSYQRIGIYNTTDGFSFGYNGTTFGIWLRYNSVDTFVSQASWNVDTLSGATGSKFTSNGTPVSLVQTNINLYRIRFGWLGIAPITFEVLSPDGVFTTVHVARFPNSQTTITVTTPNLPITVDVSKTTSDATNLAISSGCWVAGASGTMGSQFSGFGNITALSGTVVVPSNGNSSLGLNITGTWSGTLTFQYSMDGINWSNDTPYNLTTGMFVSSVTTNANIVANIASYRQYRVISTVWNSGTAVVNWNVSAGISNVIANAGGDASASATALGALNANVSLQTNSYNGAGMTITAISSPVGIVLTPQVSFDGGSTWTSSLFSDPATGSCFATLDNTRPKAFAAGQQYHILSGGGVSHIRVIATSWTSGSVTVSLRAADSDPIFKFNRNSTGTTYSAAYVLAATTNRALSNAMASTTKQFATLFHAATSLKTIRVKRVEVQIVSNSVAAQVNADLATLTSATTPATGNPAITPTALRIGSAAAEATALALPTTTGTIGGYIASACFNLGVIAGQTVQPPANSYVLFDDSLGANIEPIIIPAGTAGGIAVILGANAATTTTAAIKIVFVEE